MTVKRKEARAYMSRAIRPTYRQKQIMDKQKLDMKDWLVSKETSTELKIVNKASGRTRTIKKSA